MIRSRSIICLFALCLVYSKSIAQTVSGKILGIGGSLINGATVILKDSAMVKTIKIVHSNENGIFILKNSTSGNYKLLVTAIGYQEHQSGLIQVLDKDVTLNNIQLREITKNIEGISVEGKKNLLRQELDKYIYDVENDPDSKTGKAMDIFYKIPVIDMQGDRNIKVNGTNVAVIINGKPSLLFKGNLETALKSLPASMIKNIEIMTNPSAKYSDLGAGAIINIVLKKKQFEGYTVSGGAYTTSLNNHVATASGNLKIGKFAYSGEFTYWWQRNPTAYNEISRNDLLASKIFTSDGKSRDKGIYAFAYNALSYELDSLNLLNASVGLNDANDESSDQQTSFLYGQAGTLESRLLRNSTFSNAFSPSVSIDFQRGFKSDENKFLTVSYRFDRENGVDTNYYDRLDLIAEMLEMDRSNSSSRINQHTSQIDYTLPLKNGSTIEVGSKAIIRQTDSDNEYLSFNVASQVFVPNPMFENSFSFRQHIYSIYATYGQQIHKWGIRLGLRGERTIDDGDYSSFQTTLTRSYQNLMPSLFVSNKINKKFNLSFSYSNTVRRPGLYYLNPYVDVRNPAVVFYGNPALKPEKNHSLELNFTANAKILIRAAVYYRLTNNSIERLTFLLNNVSNSTFDNIGQRQTAGTRISFDKRYKYITASLRLNGNYVNIGSKKNTVDNDGFFYNPEARINFSRKNYFRSSIQIGYNSSMPTAQGDTRGQFYNFFSIGKDFLKNKLAISMSARNILLGDLRTGSSLTTNDFTQYYSSTFRQQEFKINFNYAFGKLKEGVKRTEKNIQNDDLKEGVKKTDVKKSY